MEEARHKKLIACQSLRIDSLELSKKAHKLLLLEDTTEDELDDMLYDIEELQEVLDQVKKCFSKANRHEYFRH